MNSPNDGHEIKPERNEKIKEVGFIGLLGVVVVGVIITIISYTIEDYLLMLLGIFILSFPWGIMAFCMEIKTRKSKIGSVIYLSIITLIGIGLVYLYAVNNFL